MQATLSVGLLALIVLTGCSATPSAEPTGAAPSSTAVAGSPSASPSASHTESLAGIAGTRWHGVHSDGDPITFMFEEGGQVTFFSYGVRYSHAQDTWRVDADTLTWQAWFGEPFGTCSYTGTFDVESQVISASATCDAPGTTGATIELRRRPEY